MQRAAYQAREAVRRFSNEDRRGFFVEGAGAFELLGKARLAAFHTALIVDLSKNIDSLLHATGAGAHTTLPVWQIKTIGTFEVIRRCLIVHKGLADYAPDLRTLADVRNSIVHLGEIPPENEKRLFIAFLNACAILVPGAGGDLTTFFGEHAALVQAYLDANVEATKVRVLTLVIAAKRRFIDRFDALGPGKGAAPKAIEATLQTEKYEEILHPCPACEQRAYLAGSLDVQWEADNYDSAGNPHSAYPVVTLEPRRLICDFCELSLRTADELKEVGLADGVPMDEVDPRDFYQDDDVF
jgi:hypothetical protein